MIDKILNDYKVILASASPRRKEILSLLKVDCEVRVSDIAEPITDEDPALQAMRHAMNKMKLIASTAAPGELIVAADTIVVLNDRILGKPKDRAEAKSFLKSLFGHKHTVITGLCVGNSRLEKCAWESTVVYFAPVSDDELEHYLDTGEPMDKAGAYGIQGFGSQFITRIEGCYFNVMGFPVHRFYETLKTMKLEGSI